MNLKTRGLKFFILILLLATNNGKASQQVQVVLLENRTDLPVDNLSGLLEETSFESIPENKVKQLENQIVLKKGEGLAFYLGANRVFLFYQGGNNFKTKVIDSTGRTQQYALNPTNVKPGGNIGIRIKHKGQKEAPASFAETPVVAPTPQPKPIIEIRDRNGLALLQEVVKQNDLVVVDYWGSKCQPCLNLLPTIHAVAKKMPNVTFVKLDIMHLANRMSYTVPMLELYKDHKRIATISWQELIPVPIPQILEKQIRQTFKL